MSLSSIRETLVAIGAVDPAHVEVLAARTRDRDVKVLRDSTSGVIFIDDHYVGDDEYVSGEYRGPDDPITLVDTVDRDRRAAALMPLCVGRRVLDFGCGRGLFLREVSAVAASVQGVELQESYREELASVGIPCAPSLATVSAPVDTVTMFHVLEHLPHPIETLQKIRGLMAPSGDLVVEVPHARDLLLADMDVEAFRSFTLWSQHLVLHTRDSLRRLLESAGFRDIDIRGVQRYGIGNHLHWLRHGEPSGHSSPLAVLETPALRQAYEDSLNRIDATDTLVAHARPVTERP